MKKRVSFVSNSSSASFIVTIEKDKESLSRLLLDKIDKFSPFSFKRELENAIVSWQKRLEEYEQKLKDLTLEEQPRFLPWITSSISSSKEHILSLESRLEKLNKLMTISDWTHLENWEFVSQVLSYHQIHKEPIFENVWKFSSWVSMFNTYDDMPEILKEIVIMGAFEKCKVICEVEED